MHDVPTSHRTAVGQCCKPHDVCSLACWVVCLFAVLACLFATPKCVCLLSAQAPRKKDASDWIQRGEYIGRIINPHSLPMFRQTERRRGETVGASPCSRTLCSTTSRIVCRAAVTNASCHCCTDRYSAIRIACLRRFAATRAAQRYTVPCRAVPQSCCGRALHVSRWSSSIVNCAMMCGAATAAARYKPHRLVCCILHAACGVLYVACCA